MGWLKKGVGIAVGVAVGLLVINTVLNFTAPNAKRWLGLS